MTNTDSRKKSASGKSGLETGGKISDEPCYGLPNHRWENPGVPRGDCRGTVLQNLALLPKHSALVPDQPHEGVRYVNL